MKITIVLALLLCLVAASGCQWAHSTQRIADASVKARTVGEGSTAGSITIEEETLEVIDPGTGRGGAR